MLSCQVLSTHQNCSSYRIRSWLTSAISIAQRFVVNCCRLSMNPDKNRSQVAWDCYYRACTDQPSSASPRPLASSSPASAAAAAEMSCTGEDPQLSSPQTQPAVSDDDDAHQLITAASAVCIGTVLFIVECFIIITEKRPV